MKIACITLFQKMLEKNLLDYQMTDEDYTIERNCGPGFNDKKVFLKTLLEKTLASTSSLCSEDLLVT